MSPRPFPGNEHDGDEPPLPAPGKGPAGNGPAGDGEWDGTAEVARLVADIDAGLIPIPDETGTAPRTWFSLAGTSDPAEVDVAGFAQGGALNARPPDAVLAAVAEMAADPAVLTALDDNQVLGLAAAGRRLAARGAWIQQAAVAEFAARRAEPDRKKATPYGFTAFAPDELAPELVITHGAAEEAMARARDASRLPACGRLLHDGLITEFGMRIITDATACLDAAGAAEADLLLAAAAPKLTPRGLRVMCTRVVLMIDPAAAQKRKDTAARHARVLRFQEYSGNAALCGRDLPPADVLASSQHIDGCARALRAGGLPGTLEQLRVLVFLDLTRGNDPMDRIPAPGDGAGQDRDTAQDGPAGDTAGLGEPIGCVPADLFDEDDDWVENAGWGENHVPRQDDHQDENDHGDEEPGRPGRAGRRGEPDRRSGPGRGRGSPPAPAPVRASIVLLVPVGTMLGWSAAPGEIPGFGLLDPRTTRDMTAAAAAHPQTRWCVTAVSPDGTAAAHGCAPGSHPWTPGPHPPPGPDPPTPAEQAAQATALLRQLKVQLSPIARGTCDHRHHTDRYVIPRGLKHLIKARASTCIAPGCSRPSADADADHTIPWPQGPSCECNLGAPCRYHHRNKQAPGWHLDQPAPGIMAWRTPSGRTHTTHPTKYLIQLLESACDG